MVLPAFSSRTLITMNFMVHCVVQYSVPLPIKQVPKGTKNPYKISAKYFGGVDTVKFFLPMCSGICETSLKDAKVST